jgi:hypothetical protein
MPQCPVAGLTSILFDLIRKPVFDFFGPHRSLVNAPKPSFSPRE